MRRSVYLAAVALLFHLGGGAAAAQEERFERIEIGLITEADRTVLSVLKREKCDLAWLSQVMRDSGVDPPYLGELPVGGKIYLRWRSCRLPVPEEVRQQTDRLLGRSAVKAPPKPRPKPVPEVAPLPPAPEVEDPKPPPAPPPQEVVLQAPPEAVPSQEARSRWRVIGRIFLWPLLALFAIGAAYLAVRWVKLRRAKRKWGNSKVVVDADPSIRSPPR